MNVQPIAESLVSRAAGFRFGDFGLGGAAEMDRILATGRWLGRAGVLSLCLGWLGHRLSLCRGRYSTDHLELLANAYRPSEENREPAALISDSPDS